MGVGMFRASHPSGLSASRTAQLTCALACIQAPQSPRCPGGVQMHTTCASDQWLAATRVQPSGGSPQRRNSLNRQARCSIHSESHGCTNPVAWLATSACSSKHAIDIEVDAIMQDVIHGARELVRERPDGDDAAGLARLAVHKFLGARLIATKEVRGLAEGP